MAGWNLKSIVLLNRKFPVIFINRIALFFFLMCFFTAFLYVLGTFQGFMDATQFILLELAAISGVLLTASSLLGMILDLVFFLREKKIRYLGGIFLHVLWGIFGGGIALAASFFTMVSGGNIN